MQIIDLDQNQRIESPGFYRLPLSRHHAQPCNRVSVTSSILRTLELATPADVWAFHDLNPDRYERDDTDALRLGRAMAALVEGGEAELGRHFACLPDDKPRRPTAAQIAKYDEGAPTEAGKLSVEFWRKVESDPRDYITQPEWEQIVACGRVLAENHAASMALGGEPEITMAWYDESTDLWVLSRPDNVSFDGLLADYKRTSPMGYFTPRWCDQQITKYGMDMQIALACEVFENLTGEWPDGGLVFQLPKPPHHVLLRAIDEEVLRLAQWRNQRARRQFRECLDSGHWPGPGEHVGSYVMPDWLFDRLQKERQVGTAPEAYEPHDSPEPITEPN